MNTCLDEAVAGLYAAYALGLYALAKAAVWVAVMILPTPPLRREIVGRAARALLRMLGIPVSVQGFESIPSGACLVVSNHASYLDALVLSAVLPSRFRFVAKKELADEGSTGSLSRRLGTVFLARSDPEKRHRGTSTLVQEIREGASLIVFPEGGFTSAPGLQPFHKGAFIVSAETGAPVVPVAIRGTRAILLEDTWFPRLGKVAVTVGPVLYADGGDLTAALRLRNRARAGILRTCGEQDLLPERALVGS